MSSFTAPSSTSNPPLTALALTLPQIPFFTAPFTASNPPITTSGLFPMIADLSQVIPSPLTFQAPVPGDVFSPPNALRLVCHIGGLHPHIPSLPYEFTIPGKLVQESKAFAKTMSATVT
ncbi:hypothetical protein PCANC_21680 [Puccinia coronata f. sp. avenae]|uniref:Uncharacterized protein n=1 Tax=Puccinia coronata f. sp. avenae TaxID=200324 RepID=A0A2N5UJA0_9BASI|nr:hypothetical protein PCANC_21680 [Puccinia coronata f. sp. avenae]